MKFQQVCEELLQLLSEGEGDMRRCFLYETEEALLTAQQVLLNLATHTLEYVDYVHWQHRLFYSSILHLILRRGELDIGTLLPSRATVKRQCMRRFARNMQAVLQQEEEARSKQPPEQQQQHLIAAADQPPSTRTLGDKQVGKRGGADGEARPKTEDTEGRVEEKKKEKKNALLLGREQGEEKTPEEQKKKTDEEKQQAAEAADEEQVREQRQQELQKLDRELSTSESDEEEDQEDEDEEEEEEEGKAEKDEAEKQRQQQLRMALNLPKMHLLYCFVKRVSRIGSPTTLPVSQADQQQNETAAARRPQAAVAPSPSAAAVEAAAPLAGQVHQRTAAAGGLAAAANAIPGGEGGRGLTEEAAAQVNQQQSSNNVGMSTASSERSSCSPEAAARNVAPAVPSPATAALASSPASASAAAASGEGSRRTTKQKTLAHLRDLVRRKGTHDVAASAAKATTLEQQPGDAQQQQQEQENAQQHPQPPQVSDTLAAASEGGAASPLIRTTATHAAAAEVTSDFCSEKQHSLQHRPEGVRAAGGAPGGSGESTAGAAAATRRSEEAGEGEELGRRRGEEARAAAAGSPRAEGTYDSSSPTNEGYGLVLREGSTFSYTSGKSFLSSHPSFMSDAGGSAESQHAAHSALVASMLGPTHYEVAATSGKGGPVNAAAAAGALGELEDAVDPQRQLQRGDSSDIDAAVVAALARTAQELPESARQALSIYHKRMKIARQYYILLHRMLLHTVEQLKPGTARGVIFEAQRRYVAVFLAIAYFRLPAFKDELLECVLSPAEREEPVPEWRGTEYSLDAHSLQRMQHWDKHSELGAVLDWTAFHDTLRGYFGAAALRRAVASMQEECGAIVCPPAAAEHSPSARGSVVSPATSPAAKPATAGGSTGRGSATNGAGGSLSVFPEELTRSWQWHFLPANRDSLFFAFLEQWCRYVFQSFPSLCSAYAPAPGAATQGGGSTPSAPTDKSAASWGGQRLGGGGGGSGVTQRRATGVPLIGAASVLQKKTAAAFAAALTGTRGKPSASRQGGGTRFGQGSRSPRASVSPAVPASQRAADIILYGSQRSYIDGSGTPAMLLLLPWQKIPGYAVLLKALLLEMKKRPVTRYPDSLLNSSGAMLANVKLLSVFSKVLFLKTSVYNSPAVFAALNYLDYWMQVVRMRGQQLPPGFDFNFLRRGLQIIVSSDLCINVAKGIWFIYKNLPVLLLLRQPSQQPAAEAVHAPEGAGARQGICCTAAGCGGSVFAGATDVNAGANILFLLVHEQFPRLFLSWSWLVRKAYMWFLLYRVCETARKVVTRANPLLAAAQAAAQTTANEPAGTKKAVAPSSPASASPAAGAAASGSSNEPAGITQPTGKRDSEAAGTQTAAPRGPAVAATGSKDTTGGTAQQGSSTAAAGPATENVSTAEMDEDSILKNLLLQLQLTEEEIILFQAYMVLASFLRRLEAPLVLPYKTTSVVSQALQRQQSRERECAAAAGAQPVSRGGRFRYMVTARSTVESSEAQNGEAAAAVARDNEIRKNGGGNLSPVAAARLRPVAGGDSGGQAEKSDICVAAGQGKLTCTEATHGAAVPLNRDTSTGAAKAHSPRVSVSAAVGRTPDATLGTRVAPAGEVVTSSSVSQQQVLRVPGGQQGVKFSITVKQSPPAPPGQSGTDGKAHPPGGQRDSEAADEEKAPAAAASAADSDDPEAEQLRMWLNGEAANLPPQRAVYAGIAEREWVEEVSLYREWVMAGASPLPSMHIPSAPLDANTDVPLDS